MALNKFGKPSIYLPICMIVWGTISASTAAVENFGGLLGVRFVLGFIEAAYFPGCLYFLSCWYTRQELPLRVSLLYSGSLLSGAFGGLIAAGIVDGMAGVAGLAAWQWLFLLEGILTVSLFWGGGWGVTFGHPGGLFPPFFSHSLVFSTINMTQR